MLTQKEVQQKQKIEEEQIIIFDERYAQEITKFMRSHYQMHMVPQLCEALKGHNSVDKHRGSVGIRKILSHKEWKGQPKFEEIIKTFIRQEMLQEYRKMLQQKQYPHLQFEAMFILRKLSFFSTKQQKQEYYKQKIILLALSILKQAKPHLHKHSLIFLGNMIFQSIPCRDYVLANGGLSFLIQLSTPITNLYEDIMWVISKLVRGLPLPPFDLTRQALFPLCQSLKNNHILKEENNVIEILCGIYCLIEEVENKEGEIQKLIDWNIIQTCKFILFKSPIFEEDALDLFMAMTLGNNDQCQELINNQIFQICFTFLTSPKPKLREKVGNIIANICCGTSQQIDILLKHNLLLQMLIKKSIGDEIGPKIQVIRIFKNMCYNGHGKKILNFFIEKDIVEYYELCLLRQKQEKMVMQIIQCLVRVVEFGDQNRVGGGNILVKRMKFTGILNRVLQIQELYRQQDANAQLMQKISQIKGLLQ